MKTPILAILSIALLTPQLFANDAKPLPNPSVNEYGIDPEAWYRGDEVTEILKASEDEAAVASVEAYNEGYKVGRIDGRDTWKPLYEDAIERAEKAEKRPTVWSLIKGTIGAFVLGAASAITYEAVR